MNEQINNESCRLVSSESCCDKSQRDSLSEIKLSNRFLLCYRLLDLINVMCIIFPLVIAFWRGVWQLMDFYSELWNKDPWLSMTVGYSVPLLLHLFQEPLKKYVNTDKLNIIVFYTVSRCLLLIHAFSVVNQWRGLWAWMDVRYGLDPVSAIVIVLVGVFFSVALNTLSNVLAPPLFCLVDNPRSIHDCSLRFKTPSTEYFKYFWSCVFSVVINPAFVVCCWRGLWTLVDIYMFPNDATESAITSTGFGIAFCITLCLAQPWISQTFRNLEGFRRKTFINIVCLFGCVGCVLAWRGVWNLMNIYFVFETPNLSEWISTIIGALGTTAMGCVSVVFRGLDIDDDMADWLISYASVTKVNSFNWNYDWESLIDRSASHVSSDDETISIMQGSSVSGCGEARNACSSI